MNLQATKRIKSLAQTGWKAAYKLFFEETYIDEKKDSSHRIGWAWGVISAPTCLSIEKGEIRRNLPGFPQG
jgi:hypothetical protein